MQLNPTEIAVWSGNIFVDEETVNQCWMLLNAEEQKKAAHLQNNRRKQFIVVRGRLRCLLAEYTHEDPATIIFSKNRYGKPFLQNNEDLVFNISHSADKLLIAVAVQCQMGVDIEIWKPRGDLMPLVDRCFALSEKKYWSGLPFSTRTAAFYSIWTRKEAFVKAVGRGIALGLQHCVTAPQAPGNFVAVPEQYKPATAWKIFNINAGDQTSAALVVRSCEQEITLYTRNLI